MRGDPTRRHTAMATSEDRQHAERLIREHKKRLRLLEVRLARQGDSADPSVEREIDDIKAALSDLEGHAPSAIVTEARQVVRNQYDNDIDFLIADGAARNRRQTKTEETVAATAHELHSVKDDVIAMKADVEELKKGHTTEQKAREHGQKRNFRISIGNIALLLLLAFFVWIVLARAGLL
jgi:hypothetical protein